MEPLIDILAALLVVGGILGIVLPLLPGTPLMFAGALLYDWNHAWSAYGPLWLALLLLLVLLSEGGDWWLSNAGARRGGASWQALLVGALLGLIGLVALPPFGFLIGSVVGVAGTEMLRARDGRRALRAGSGWLAGWLLSMALQGTVALVMLGIILWQS